jgi:hypothetical protein
MGSVSFTVTVKLHVAVAPPASVARQLTVVVPMAKFEPLGGEHATPAPVQLSNANGVAKLTAAVHFPRSFDWVMLPGHVILGGGLLAIVVAVDMLLIGLGSGVEALNTTAVLPITVPLATEQFT